MGVCLDPSDCTWRISGSSVGPFRGYPLLRIRMDGVPMRLVERNARLVSAKDYTSIISA